MSSNIDVTTIAKLRCGCQVLILEKRKKGEWSNCTNCGHQEKILQIISQGLTTGTIGE